MSVTTATEENLLDRSSLQAHSHSSSSFAAASRACSTAPSEEYNIGSDDEVSLSDEESDNFLYGIPTSSLDAPPQQPNIELHKANPELYVAIANQKAQIRRNAFSPLPKPSDPQEDQQTYQQPSTYHPTFPQFKKLPIELRLRIWEFATDYPRVIKTTFSALGYPKSSTIVPAVMHACGESREEALRHYSRLGRPPRKDEIHREPWINWSLDLVLPGSKVKLEALLGGEKFTQQRVNLKAERLAIPLHLCGALQAGLDAEKNFLGIKQLIVVFGMDWVERTQEYDVELELVPKTATQLVNDPNVLGLSRHLQTIERFVGVELVLMSVIMKESRQTIKRREETKEKEKLKQDKKLGEDLLLAACLQDMYDKREIEEL